MAVRRARQLPAVLYGIEVHRTDGTAPEFVGPVEPQADSTDVTRVTLAGNTDALPGSARRAGWRR